MWMDGGRGGKSSMEDPEFIPRRPGGANQTWGIMEMTSNREFSENLARFFLAFEFKFWD